MKEDHYMAKKLKLISVGSKHHKMATEMCEWIQERFEEWSHEARDEMQSLSHSENDDQDIWKYVNLTRFCVSKLMHKNQALCTEEMVSNRLSLYRESKKLPSSKSKSSSKRWISWIPRRLWIVLDFVMVYGLIMTVLVMFSVLEVPAVICKISIIAILFEPFYLRSQYPQWPISRWIYVCYW